MNEQNESNSWNIFYMKRIVVILSALILSVIICFCAWFGFLNIFSDKPEIWFQRSGSLMIVAFVFADYYVYKLLADVNDINMYSEHVIRVKDNYRPYVAMLYRLAIFLTICATIIWGYGDLLYSYIMQP